jgi:hypothetical protein
MTAQAASAARFPGLSPAGAQPGPGTAMNTLRQPTVSEPLAARIAKAMEEVEAWYAGGLPPEPWGPLAA